MQPVPPCSAPACWWQLWVLGGAIRHIICGFYLFIFPPSYVALWDSKTPHRPAAERVSWCLEISPLLRLPSRDGSPSLSLLPLFLSFIFFLTSFWWQWAAFLGDWCPLPTFRSCSVEFNQCSNVLSMNLWGRTWSPHPIPPPSSSSSLFSLSWWYRL